MGPIIEEMHHVDAERAMLSSMLPVVSCLIDHAEEFTKKYSSLATIKSNSTDDDCRTSGSKVEGVDSNMSLGRVFRKRLIDFYMKDSMLAAYMLDPANFTTLNEGAVFQLPCKVITDDDVTNLLDEGRS
jgi:hypothetical protein